MDHDAGANIWDFSNVELMDDCLLWEQNSGFQTDVFRAAEIMESRRDVQLQSPGCSGDFQLSDGNNRSTKTELPPVLDLGNMWFTKIHRKGESLYDSPFTPASTSTYQSNLSPRVPEVVVEDCRLGLSKALIPPSPQDDLLPSSEFLVSSG